MVKKKSNAYHLFIVIKAVVLAFALFIIAPACNHYISPFDQLAYTQTTSLKVDVLNLMDESSESYGSHQKEIENVVSNLRKAIEYEKHRPKNDITLRMWNKMLDSTAQKGIIGSYFSSWKKNGTKNQTMIDEYKPLTAQGFDLIAELEAQKIKTSDQNITTFLNK